MNTHNIAGREVHVWSRGVTKYLWTTVEYFVHVIDGEIFKSPDRLEGFGSIVKFKLDTNDCIYELRTKKPVSLIYSRYVILENGVEIARGTVTANNWYIFYGALIVAGSFLYAYASIT